MYFYEQKVPVLVVFVSRSIHCC